MPKSLTLISSFSWHYLAREFLQMHTVCLKLQCQEHKFPSDSLWPLKCTPHRERSQPERVTKPNARMSGWIITVGLLNNSECVQSSRHCICYVPKNSESLQHCETTTSNVTIYKAGREMLNLPKVTQLECSWVNLSSGIVPAETAFHHYTTEKML